MDISVHHESAVLMLLQMSQSCDDILHRIVTQVEHTIHCEKNMELCTPGLELLCLIIRQHGLKESDSGYVPVTNSTAISNLLLGDITDHILKPAMVRLCTSDVPSGALLPLLCEIFCQGCEVGDRSAWLVEECLRNFGKEEETICLISCRRIALDVLNCLSTLCKKFPRTETLLRSLSSRVVEILPKMIPTPILGKFSVVLKQLLTLNGDPVQLLRSIWNAVCGVSVPFEKAFIVVCALADFYIGTDDYSSALYRDASLWRLVQAGLASDDTLTRKRALYVLKRIVDNLETMNVEDVVTSSDGHEEALFRWSEKRRSEYSTLWQDYILITEMLEEKQVHVIRPLLPRWDSVAAATQRRPDAAPLMHTSWLVTLFRRTAVHSSAFVQRWGLDRLLGVDCVMVPLLEQGQDRFIISELPSVLNQSVHYLRQGDTPYAACPPIADKLAVFLQSCHSAFGADDEQRALFFRAFIRGIQSVSWSGVPLMFLCRALALLPRTNILDSATIDVVRLFCTKYIRTVYVDQRGAVQVFLTQALWNLIDQSQTTLTDVMRFLAVLRSDEAFPRGALAWRQSVDWMRTSTWALDSGTHLKVMVDALLKVDKNSELYNLTTECLSLVFVKTFYLCLDAGLLQGDTATSAEAILYPLFETAASANRRLYLSREKADAALATVVHLVDEQGTGQLEPAIGRFVSQSRAELLDYAVMRLLAATSTDDASFYLSALYQLSRFGSDSSREQAVLTVMETMLISVDKLQSTNVTEQTMACMALSGLAELCRVFTESTEHWRTTTSRNDVDDTFGRCVESLLQFMDTYNVIHTIPRPENNHDCGEGVKSVDWNRLVSTAVQSQWRCLAFWLQCEPVWAGSARAGHGTGGADGARVRWQTILDECLGALDRGSKFILAPIFECLTVIFAKACDLSDESIGRCIEFCWSKLAETGSCPDAFWPAYECLVTMCYQPTLLAREGLTPILLKLADDIFVCGEIRVGVMYVLISRWCQLVSSSDTIASTRPYVGHLVRATMFGPVHKKGDKMVQDISAYIATIEHLEPGKPPVNRDDIRVRICMVTLLATLDRRVDGNVRLLTEFGLVVMETWREITRTRRRHTFVNSLRHRETHRLMASLLLISDVMLKEEAERLLEFVCEVLVNEGQPSVRFLAEWLAIGVCSLDRRYWTYIWTNLSAVDVEKKPAVQCSWLMVMTHVAKLLPSTDTAEFLSRAVTAVLPLCMAHQFNLRIFGQASLLSLWQLCEREGLEKFAQVRLVLDSIRNFVAASGNSSRCTLTLLDHFSLKFHPTLDYSVQTIFESIPRLYQMNDDEWIPVAMFTSAEPDIWRRNPPTRLPLRNARDVLDHCQTGAWKMRTDDSEAIELTIGDVQRKITPWKRMLPDDEAEMELKHSDRKQDGGLVLVASLIDKTPNLGGLCRTCEVFGASEFVVGSMAYVKDAHFVGLSVSAQKWIPITEVQPGFLKEYLVMMQRAGYTLIGVEQTANSRCLTDFTFPEKSLLLLGNEKEGVPVELIQLLDVCVEIPQQGIIRSLNVHVCGALLMWEYRRQRLLAT